MHWPRWFGLVVLILTLVGYPIVAMLATYLSAPSELFSTPFRMLVFALAVIAMIGAAITGGQRPDALLLLFMVIYGLRLVFDWWVHDVVDADAALLFYGIVVFVPAVSVALSGAASFRDEFTAIWLMTGASVVVIASLIADRLGMRFNPYAELSVDTGRLSFEALNSISLANSASIAILSGVFLFLSSNNAISFRVAGAFGAVIGAWVMLLANARGPMVATALALGWYFLLRVKNLIFLAPLGLVVLLLLPPLISFNSDLAANVEQLVANVEQRFSGGLLESKSGLSRIIVMEEAWDAFLRAPIFGESYAIPRGEGGVYPHNIIIETAMSLGLIGLCVFFAILVRLWARIRTGLNAAHPLLVMLIVQKFVGANFSGSIWGADALFVLVGLAFAASTRPDRRYASEPTRIGGHRVIASWGPPQNR